MNHFLCWLAMVACIWSGCVAASDALREPLRLGYSDAPAPPFQIAHTEDPPGIAFELIEQMARDLGLTLEFYRLPNKRVLEWVKWGNLDGAFMYSYKPDRAVYAVYPRRDGKLDRSRRLATLSYYFFIRKGSTLDWDGVRLGGAPLVGVNRGYSVISELQRLGAKVMEVHTTEQNISLLLLGRTDAYAQQGLVVASYLNASQLSDAIQRVAPPISTKDYYLIFSQPFVQRAPQLAEKIWTHIGTVRDAVTDRVIDRYTDARTP